MLVRLLRNYNLQSIFFLIISLFRKSTARRRLARVISLKICMFCSSTLPSQSTAYVNSIFSRVWHNRLGHLSFKKLDCLRSHLDLDSTKYNKADPCYICPLAIQQRLSFVSNNHMAKSPFDLIHCDVWRPYHVSSHSGYKYFLTLVNDCTQFT